MNAHITVTDAACAYIQKMLDQEPGKSFRLSVKKTGCSGYSYFPALVDQLQPSDIRCDTQTLTLWVDGTWLSLLQGIQVDYIEEEKAGLKQKRLVFINPNESSRCGCGESFHVE